MRSVLISALMLLLAGTAVAQTKVEPKKPEGENAPSSLEPYYPKEKKAPKQKKSKKSSTAATYESEQHYYDRMARLVKEKRKIEKDMEKPQYSNPAYFGHKRPPKKHKRGKLKFCKECGIRH
jgi:hypothetical protein